MPLAKFDYTLDYKNLNLREHPELYRTGLGEQGVLLVEPYKSEILPFWKFKTPVLAQVSADKIYQLFLAYIRKNDFVGMDMARKFLQMGYTRSLRYANHPSGKKYKGPVDEDKNGQMNDHDREELPAFPDPQKAASAAIFYAAWQKAKKNNIYQEMMRVHKEQYRTKA
ncbi:MAG: DUF4385 domain-containing protein [Chitinophagaceae bacterium]